MSPTTSSFPVVSMVFPTSMVTTNYTTDGVAMTNVSATLPNYQTHPSLVMSMSDDESASGSGIIITEINDGKDALNVNNKLHPAAMKRRNSMSTTNAKEILSRQISTDSKSTDSPSLPKRNQPITSSAPSTLTKAKTEAKTGEVYV